MIVGCSNTAETFIQPVRDIEHRFPMLMFHDNGVIRFGYSNPTFLITANKLAIREPSRGLNKRGLNNVTENRSKT